MPPAIASLLAAITINDAMSAPLAVDDGKVAVGNSNRRATSRRSDNAAPVIICIVKAVGLGVPALAGSPDRARFDCVGVGRGGILRRSPSILNGEDGIAVHGDARENAVKRNTVRDNGRDGIDLEDADGNTIIGNTVKRNGRKRDRDSGIELEDSDRNLVDGNRVRGNADGLTDVIRCISGDENVGSNVPRHCR